ncbi:hypothetical protein K435DRAFT_680430, partial [Dendrothele bispora CBS 962.96]
MDSGKTRQRLGKLPLVIGMPVMITQNFDVAGGVVNGSIGALKSIRYRLDRAGRRHAISCVVTLPPSPLHHQALPHLENHDVVALQDTVELKIQH